MCDNVYCSQRRDPIRWHKEIILYEDELHDNGISKVFVKIRVMDYCFLCLLRQWLRIDGICLFMEDMMKYYRLYRCYGKNT